MEILRKELRLEIRKKERRGVHKHIIAMLEHWIKVTCNRCKRLVSPMSALEVDEQMSMRQNITFFLLYYIFPIVTFIIPQLYIRVTQRLFAILIFNACMQSFFV